MVTTMTEKTFLTIQEAAYLLGTTHDALYKQVIRGTFPAMRISPKRWRIDVRDITAFLKSNSNGVHVPKSSRTMDLDYYDSIPVPSPLL